MAIAASIRDFLKRERVPYTIFAHRPAYGAQQEAQVAHIQGRHWAKAVVCFADANHVTCAMKIDISMSVRTARHVEAPRFAGR